jgi:predicted GIY-YIG superfamily endonuclease
LDLVTGNAAMNAILDVAAQANWQNAHHNLYVVELRSEIFVRERRFSEKNPHWLPGKSCVYVGMTGLPPEERLREHHNGNHSARFVKKYGMRLLPEPCKRFNSMPYDLATVMEVELARQLREQGFGVWQN